jgi:hypothetical protein
MNYKKIIKNREVRLKILSSLEFIPDKLMIYFQYFLKFNRLLSLKNPERFTEKLQWYKLNYRDPLMVKCVDKYLVRDYIKSKKLNSLLNEVYGIYNHPDEIDFSVLPNQFVIKTTDGGGGNNIIICKDKKKINIKNAKNNLLNWLNSNKSLSGGREWSYRHSKSRIIIENYIENPENSKAGISDFKFFCFNGKPEYIVVDIDRYIDHKRNFYDVQWNLIDVESDHSNFGDTMSKPDNLDDLLKVATILSEDFPFVRVDLYNVENEIIFGELTFYPWSGYVQFKPDSFDYELGDKFELPEKLNPAE